MPILINDGTKVPTESTLLASSTIAVNGARTIFCNATSGAQTQTLFTVATALAGWEGLFVKTDSSANAVTIAGTIDGTTNYVLTAQYQYVRIHFDGTSFYVVGSGNGYSIANGRKTGQTALVTSVVALTVGAVDSTYLVSANVNVTTSTTHSFTVTCAYTDETSASNTLTLSFSQLTGTFLTAITNLTGSGAYEGIPLQIRAKAGTSITIATVGTFTSVTYNVQGNLSQIG